jgi:hypothetical protein
MTKMLTTYDWVRDIEPYLDTMQPVEGGYSTARRGIVTIADGTKIFVKMAEGETTMKWVRKEILAYQRLNDAGYPYIPHLLAYNTNYSAMAIEYLENASFENVWDTSKLDAIIQAQDELKKYVSLFDNDSDFTLESVVGLDSKWPIILADDNLEKINNKFIKIGVEEIFTKDQIESYERLLVGWKINDTVLVHQDIRADNFGYDSITKTGKLIDWNWLCLGDSSLDSTPLFVNTYMSGFDPYEHHPDKYDPKMLAYMISFWLERVLSGDEDESDMSMRRIVAQAKSVKTAVELLERSH